MDRKLAIVYARGYCALCQVRVGIRYLQLDPETMKPTCHRCVHPLTMLARQQRAGWRR